MNGMHTATIIKRQRPSLRQCPSRLETGTIFHVEAYEYMSVAPGLLSRFVPIEQWPMCPPLSRGSNFGVLSASRLKQACRYWGRLEPVKTIWRHMDEISFPTYFY